MVKQFKPLTIENLKFLAQLYEEGCSENQIMGFQQAMSQHKKLDQLAFIQEQLPYYDDLDVDTHETFISRRSYLDLGEYVEITEAPEIWLGSRMWYLEMDRQGFYWVGNTCYGESEWDNDTVIRIPSTRFNDKEYVARKLYQDFVTSGNPKDRWAKVEENSEKLNKNLE